MIRDLIPGTDLGDSIKVTTKFKLFFRKKFVKDFDIII